MVKKIIAVFIVITVPFIVLGQSFKQTFISTDIDNFLKAYDKITSTNDTVVQYQYLQELYIDKGSDGLKSLMLVRNYTPREILSYINDCPLFWKSIRNNLLTLSNMYGEIETDIRRLKLAYPNLKQVPIYFSVGAFRTNGTVHENKVLIACETALADEHTDIHELPEWRQPFYKTQQPRKNLALLCTHEYIHTQQKPLVYNLVSMCLYEGIAEFISCKVTYKKSLTPIDFGKTHEEEIKKQFVEDLFIMSNDYNWLWGENRNQFQMRDLGYYIGYEIAERYYDLSSDKSKAIQELIELDYENEQEVERIVDATNFLPQKLQLLNVAYEKQRPTIVGILPFANGSKDVNPGKLIITFNFSEPLNGQNAGMDYGPLGEQTLPPINQESRRWADDKKSYSFEVNLAPKQHYQLLITNGFMKENQIRLKPYLIEFWTK